jgi:hypothetical protein
MNSYYLDSSALLPLIVPDAHSKVMAAWLDTTQRFLVVSDFARAEASASISRRVRMELLTAPQAEAMLARLDFWVAQTARHRLTSAAEIAACDRLIRRFELKLQAPDALHIAIALADGVTLVTFDERQAQAMAGLGPCVVPA